MTADRVASGATFYLFVYGTLRSGGVSNGVLAGCERVADAAVAGALYDIDGRYPAMLLYGDGPVLGEVWRCPASLLPKLDAFEGVTDGHFRRVGLHVDGYACWTYVAGPRLARKVVAERRIATGDWVGR